MGIKLNIANPSTGGQKLIEVEDDKKLCAALPQATRAGLPRLPSPPPPPATPVAARAAGSPRDF